MPSEKTAPAVDLRCLIFSAQGTLTDAEGNPCSVQEALTANARFGDFMIYLPQQYSFDRQEIRATTQKAARERLVLLDQVETGTLLTEHKPDIGMMREERRKTLALLENIDASIERLQQYTREVPPAQNRDASILDHYIAHLPPDLFAIINRGNNVLVAVPDGLEQVSDFPRQLKIRTSLSCTGISRYVAEIPHSVIHTITQMPSAATHDIDDAMIEIALYSGGLMHLLDPRKTPAAAAALKEIEEKALPDAQFVGDPDCETAILINEFSHQKFRDRRDPDEYPRLDAFFKEVQRALDLKKREIEVSSNSSPEETPETILADTDLRKLLTLSDDTIPAAPAPAAFIDSPHASKAEVKKIIFAPPRGIGEAGESFTPRTDLRPEAMAFFEALNHALRTLGVSATEFDHAFSDMAMQQIVCVSNTAARKAESDPAVLAALNLPAISPIAESILKDAHITAKYSPHTKPRAAKAGIDIKKAAISEATGAAAYCSAYLAMGMTPFLRTIDLTEFEHRQKEGMNLQNTYDYYQRRNLKEALKKEGILVAPDDYGHTLHQYAAGLLKFRDLKSKVVGASLIVSDEGTKNQAANYFASFTRRDFFRHALLNTISSLAHAKGAPEETAALLRSQMETALFAAIEPTRDVEYEAQAGAATPAAASYSPRAGLHLANEKLERTLSEGKWHHYTADNFLKETELLRSLLEQSGDQARWEALFSPGVLAPLEASIRRSNGDTHAWDAIDKNSSELAKARDIARSIVFKGGSKPLQQKIRAQLLKCPTLLACMTGRKDVLESVMQQAGIWQEEWQKSKKDWAIHNQLLATNPSGIGQQVSTSGSATEAVYAEKAKILLGDKPDAIIPPPQPKARPAAAPAPSRPAFTSGGNYRYVEPAAVNAKNNGHDKHQESGNGRGGRNALSASATLAMAGGAAMTASTVTPPPRRFTGETARESILLTEAPATAAAAKPKEDPIVKARREAMKATGKHITRWIEESAQALRDKIKESRKSEKRFSDYTLHAKCYLEGKTLVLRLYQLETCGSDIHVRQVNGVAFDIRKSFDFGAANISSGFSDERLPIRVDELNTLLETAHSIIEKHGFELFNPVVAENGALLVGAYDKIAPNAMRDDEAKRKLTLSTEGNWYGLTIEAKYRDEANYPARLCIPLGLLTEDGKKTLSKLEFPKEFRPADLPRLAQSGNARLAELAHRIGIVLNQLSAHHKTNYADSGSAGKPLFKFELTDHLQAVLEQEEKTWERKEKRALEFRNNDRELAEVPIETKKRAPAVLYLPERADGKKPRLIIGAPLLELDTGRTHGTWRMDFDIHYNPDIQENGDVQGPALYHRTVDLCTDNDAHALRRANRMLCDEERGLIGRLNERVTQPRPPLNHDDMLRFVHDYAPRFEHDILVEGRAGTPDEARHVIPLTFTLLRGGSDKPGEEKKTERLINCDRRGRVLVDFPLDRQEQMAEFIEEVSARAMEKIRWHYSAIEPQLVPPPLKTRKEVLDYFRRLDTQPAGAPPEGFQRKKDGYPDMRHEVPCQLVEDAIGECGRALGLKAASAKASLPKAPRRTLAPGELPESGKWQDQVQSQKPPERECWTLGGGLL